MLLYLEVPLSNWLRWYHFHMLQEQRATTFDFWTDLNISFYSYPSLYQHIFLQPPNQCWSHKWVFKNIRIMLGLLTSEWKTVKYLTVSPCAKEEISWSVTQEYWSVSQIQPTRETGHFGRAELEHIHVFHGVWKQSVLIL